MSDLLVAAFAAIPFAAVIGWHRIPRRGVK